MIPTNRGDKIGSYHDSVKRPTVGGLHRVAAGQTGWSNFDQQPRQSVLANMLVSWRTCPLYTLNGVHRHRLAFIAKRSKRCSGARALADMVPDFPAATCR
jgi:hypothetical protein